MAYIAQTIAKMMTAFKTLGMLLEMDSMITRKPHSRLTTLKIRSDIKIRLSGLKFKI